VASSPGSIAISGSGCFPIRLTRLRGAGYVSADHAVQYRELVAARERDASIILDIQAAVERMQELARFRREIDATWLCLVPP
jgi:hypothetical protein